MIRLNENLAAARTSQERASFQRQIEFTNLSIDEAVYRLYGLTADEIDLARSA